MATVSTYLNFEGKTEEAFMFYKEIFRTELVAQPTRFRDVPPMEGMPPIPENELDNIMHIMLPTIGDHSLMGTDASESMGHKLHFGNNISIFLQPDSLSEGRRLFDALSDQGKVQMPFTPQFWGDTYGALTDRYGVQWMVNVAGAAVQ